MTNKLDTANVTNFIYVYEATDRITNRVDALNRCPDRCKPGEVRFEASSFELKLTPPQRTVGEDEAADIAVEALEEAWHCSHYITPHPSHVVVGKLLDFGNIGAWYGEVKEGILNHRAWMYVRVKYQVCEKRRCWLFNKKYHDWGGYRETEWENCNTGWNEDMGMGWYWGKDHALRNAEACFQEHLRKEFGR